MSLATGTRLGPYEVLGLIGIGGMGEVYRARDTRLDRTVAIKVLPPAKEWQADLRVRFEREAKTVASLNHPHICTLYDVGDHDGVMFLVMEHVVGETLATFLLRGSPPLGQVLTLGAQIAEALAAAHDAGITHRDLKPGNIMLTASGIKLLDFGLAKWNAPVGPPDGGLTTCAGPASVTTPGLLLGTPGYMSPEQARGEPVDTRSDLFAWGCVVYEMLSGAPPFRGATPSDRLTSVLRDDPPPLPAERVPAGLERLVRRCLEKNPRARFQSALDAACVMKSLRSDTAVVPAPSSRRGAARVAGLVLAATTAGLALGWYWRPAPPLPISHTIVSLAAADLVVAYRGLAISPDGQTLAFAARQQDERPRLYVRSLSNPEPRPLPGTEDGVAPLFSPDGKWLAFAANGRLQKVLVQGGEVQTLCPIGYQGLSRGFWSADGRIFFSEWPGGLRTVPDSGGTPTMIVASAAIGDSNLICPQLLPGGQRLLYTVIRNGRGEVAALSFATGRSDTVLQNASCARYLPTGHLVYESGGSLRAVGFDPAALATFGTPRMVFANVAAGREPVIGVDYDVSATGTLLATPQSALISRLVWKDRTGNTSVLPFDEQDYRWPSLSADGRRFSVTVVRWPSANVYVGRIDRAPLTQVTFDGSDCCGVLSHDGHWVVFSSRPVGWSNLFRVPADGAGRPQALTSVSSHQKPTSFSPDDRRVLFNDFSGQEWRRDIAELDLASPFRTQPLIRTAANELEAVFSPDGRTIAYQSDESGQWEIYLRPYRGPGERQQVSVNGGMGPAWNLQGTELFYQTRTALMAARIQNGIAEPPIRLFATPKGEDYRREFDVAPDGRRFLFLEPAASRTDIEMVQNWFAELQAKVPVR